jgi:hypothetical protein
MLNFVWDNICMNIFSHITSFLHIIQREVILHVTVPTHVWREMSARLSTRPGLNTVVASIAERLATSVLTAPSQLATRLVTTAEVKDTLPRSAPIHENKLHDPCSC